MYFLPKLQIPKQKIDTIAKFKGLNECVVIEDGELSDCFNISTKELPALNAVDGYSYFLEGPVPNGICRAHADSNVMITKNNESGLGSVVYQCFVTTPSRDYEVKIKQDAPFQVINYDFWGEKLAILAVEQNPNKLYIHLYDISYEHRNDTKPTESYEITELVDSDFSHIVGIIAFGDRMILLERTIVHISYMNDLSKWTVFSEEGQYSAKAAQAIEILDDGNFTAGTNYRDYPIFFKKSSMYILYNEYNPFTVSRIDNVGCTSPDTLAECNGALYFLSDTGVMEYTGGTPRLISQDVDIQGDTDLNVDFHFACADNRFYYIDNYIYDTYERVWSKQRHLENYTDEDGSINYRILPQCFFRNRIYITESRQTTGFGESPSHAETLYYFDADKLSDWSFTTKQFHEYQAGKKIVSKIAVGFEKDNATALKIELRLDKKPFQTVYTWNGTTDFMKEVPVILPPCDYFQLRISGTGKLIVHYIKRMYRILGEW